MSCDHVPLAAKSNTSPTSPMLARAWILEPTLNWSPVLVTVSRNLMLVASDAPAGSTQHVPGVTPDAPVIALKAGPSSVLSSSANNPAREIHCWASAAVPNENASTIARSIVFIFDLRSRERGSSQANSLDAFCFGV